MQHEPEKYQYLRRRARPDEQGMLGGWQARRTRVICTGNRNTASSCLGSLEPLLIGPIEGRRGLEEVREGKVVGLGTVLDAALDHAATGVMALVMQRLAINDPAAL